MNSRDKGKRGELEFAEFLRAHGYIAERGQQHKGGADSQDVTHNVPGVHFEVKRTERTSIEEWLAQAGRDADPTNLPVVAHRKNKHPWVVILDLTDFLSLVERANGKPTV